MPISVVRRSLPTIGILSSTRENLNVKFIILEGGNYPSGKGFYKIRTKIDIVARDYLKVEVLWVN